jgi:hypothetical protein
VTTTPANPHSVATDALDTLGTIIDSTQQRDAIHLGVQPAQAAMPLTVGQHVALVQGMAYGGAGLAPGTKTVGIVDPFLTAPVMPGQWFWLVVYPRQITSLRHVWTHPDFDSEAPATPAAQAAPAETAKVASQQWMQAWASQHMADDYYSSGDGKLAPEVAYATAIQAGHDHHVGPHEDAREHIDSEWWGHWETITGKRGQRADYFSCGC